MGPRRPHQRGSMLPLTGVFMTVTTVLAALAVDIGRLSWTASEVQSAADGSALAGAKGLAVSAAHPLPTPVPDAIAVAAMNRTDGQPTHLAPPDIDVGNWAHGTFTVTPFNVNAVRTRPHVPVSNIMPVFHNATTTVNKQATAAYRTLGTAVPTLPIAIAQDCFACTVASCPPSIFVINFSSVPVNNAAWFYPSSTTGAPGIDQFVPACPNGSGGGGQPMGSFSDGDVLSLNNGSIASLCNKDFQCLVGQQFVIPVVQSQCSIPLNGSDPIVGFATITLQSTACPQSMTFTISFNDQGVGNLDGDTCPSCGTGRFALVQ